MYRVRLLPWWLVERATGAAVLCRSVFTEDDGAGDVKLFISRLSAADAAGPYACEADIDGELYHAEVVIAIDGIGPPRRRHVHPPPHLSYPLPVANTS